MRIVMCGDVAAVMGMHVDGRFIAGASRVREEVVAVLNDVLPTKHLRDLAWYMGSEYGKDRTTGTLEISQKSLVRVGLTDFRFHSLAVCPLLLVWVSGS